MRILVGNKAFGDMPGGSESYAYALIAELIRLGHNVEGFCTKRRGKIAESIELLGARVHTGGLDDVTYDVIFASHVQTIDRLKKMRVRHHV